jgi:fructoselysine 6-kinase
MQLTPEAVRICAVGDNVVDRYVDRGLLYPGGNAVNVAVHARRCGARTAYVGAIGDDAAGALVGDVLAREGVDTDRLRRLPGANAYATVRLVDGERVFGSGSLGVSRFVLADADFAYLRGFQLVHTGDCSGTEDQLAEIARAAPVSFDFAEHGPEYVEPLLPFVRLATFSRSGSSPAEVADLVAWAHAGGAAQVLVTRGPAGASYFDGRELYHHPAAAVEVVDTLGAGDAFIARAGVELLRGTSPADVLAQAVQYAAEACRSDGAFGYPTDDTLPAPEPFRPVPADAIPHPLPTAQR